MKNFINYLSKKSLSLGNGSGMTRKWFGNGSGMTRFSLASLICVLMLTIGVGNAWGDPTMLFHETFGNNTGSARDWNNSYSVKSGVSAVYSGITGYTVSNCKQGKNTTGSMQSGLNQTTQGTDAYIIIGPLSVASYSSLGVTYQWKAGSIKGTYTTKLYYATSSRGIYTEVSGTGTGATSFVERSYSLPVAAQVSTLYLKIVWNTSNTQAIIDEVELTGTAAASCDKKVTIVKGTPETGGSFNLDKTGAQDCCSALTVTVSNITAPSGKEFDAITQSGIATGVTINQSAKTVTYAANSTGTSTINVTFRDLPKYTVTLMDDGDTRTQASAGAGVTLPSRAGCTGYTFAGWTKTWVAPQSSWTTTAPTIIPAGSYTPAADENLYPVYTKTEGGGGSTTESYGWETADDATNWTISGIEKYDTYKKTGSYSGKIARSSAGESTIAFKDKVKVTSFSFQFLRQTTNNNYNVRIETSSDGSSWDDVESYNMSTFSTKETWYAKSHSFDGKTALYVRFVCYTSTAVRWVDDISITYVGGSTTYYISVPGCCTDPELAYGTGSVTKTFGEGVFTNTLTNSHSVAVTYSSSDPTVATVNGSGQVTILKAGSTTITASSAAQTVAAVSYCADEASYTLTVNKASISPTLSYDPASVTVGSTLTSFTLSGNSGSGTVTYVSSNDAIATVNSSGVVTGVAPGTVTITATIAATTNYNGNTATSNTITVNAAACTGVNSLHTGNKDQGGWVTNQCFEDADWGADDDAIYVGAFPLTNECYVGWAGGGSYYGTNWAVGGIKTYDIPTGRTLGWNSGNYYESYPGGALGTFHIYKNSKDENYYLRFKPSSYILRTGSDGTSWTSREMTVSATNSHYYETAELDLTSTLISEHAYVDLKTNGGDGHVWCNFSNDRTASGNVKVKSSVGDADGNFRGDNLKASDNGTHGKFRIDITKDVDNWKLAFVPMYRITYAAGTGALGSMDPSSYAEISTTIAAAANGFTAPTGKQFNGWSDGVNTYSAGDNVTMNSNVTLTAQWTDIDYTVTVNQNPSVGATTTGQTTTAHYNGTINLTTTVPSGYRFVNWTTTDGFSITNPTSATTASFTMPNKNVTVTANFQQTHTVDWYVGGSAVGNKLDDDGQTTVVDHGGKISAFPATTPDGSACDKTFVGWTNTSSYVHGTSPLFTTVEGSPTINANASFYAVFATESGGSSTVFSEDFSTCSGTGGNSGGWSGSIASASVPSGISTSWYLSKANAADECLKLGTGSAGGSAETPDIDCGTATSATLTFRAGAWDGSSEGTTLSLSASNCSIDKSSVTLEKGSFTSYTVAITSITDDIAITFYTSSGNQRFFLDDVVVTASTLTYTGHTITCSDCGSSVTPTYTASPAGGTVSVTKSAAAVASGSTVKTCTSVDLTVTITPASHYTLTGFTATGLTTGTATISPAVNTVVPTTSAQTFTVTVSSGATGTLTLTPTFTPETPLTITLNTNGKGTYTDPAEWPIYAGESFTLPDVTPSDPTCATFVGWIQGTTFPGDATTHDAPLTISAGSSSGELSVNTTYTAVFYETETAESDAYVKVTSAPVNWANDHYLIVYEDGGVAFDGSLSTLDASSNTVAVSISSGAIAATSALAASEWKIALISGSNYSIQSASGKYIGNASNSNGLTADNTALGNTLSISSENFGVVSAGGAYLRYNATSGQERFRYYKSSSYSSQQAIQLYKLGTAVVETRTYTTNPACTPKYRVTVASVTSGSPNANPKFLPENEEVTLTANPAAGYSFTGWTITKTTGGNDVTTTLLGANATTANTSFSMPAYDVTVTASYAKIPVASLQVKDGETVIANSGTVNISTGANKTLTVVVTPADAFDHSWSASVTGGGTYASITNVQAGTFQVNGLAQGDATVTVTAPNDGDAKTVTFTVHVTDILPTEVVLKRDGSNTSISELSIYEGQYVKVNVSFTPTPTNKDFSVSADGTFVTIHAQAHTNPNYYAMLNGKKVTTSPVNVTFTSAATSSVTKNLVVTVLPLLTDTFVDYIHGQATQTVSARLSADKFTLYTDINTPSLSDASDADPTSADCETSHYHLIGWLPKATAESLWAAGTAITESTEGLVKAGVQVEAIGQTWYAIWGKEQ